MRASDFDFPLPEELIAQHPLDQRSASRLLIVPPGDGPLRDGRFTDIETQLRPGDVLVSNDTRVIKARLRGRKLTGGAVEVLIERILGAHEALAMVRASKSPGAGAELVFGGVRATVMGREGEFFRLAFTGDSLARILEQHGELPLPPYIARPATAQDEQRYQTVFAREDGAVAAPTAGLHFDEPLLARLDERGVERVSVTLHVGAGTFQPVRGESLADHVMHAERYSIPAGTVAAIGRARARGARVVAVGTTSVRALESAAASGELQSGDGETRLFITPGYRFQVVDAMLTNFHLPRSTLLMLVSAFAGQQRMGSAYAHAVRQGYRFFSYGDAMFISRSAHEF